MARKSRSRGNSSNSTPSRVPPNTGPPGISGVPTVDMHLTAADLEAIAQSGTQDSVSIQLPGGSQGNARSSASTDVTSTNNQPSSVESVDQPTIPGSGMFQSGKSSGPAYLESTFKLREKEISIHENLEEKGATNTSTKGVVLSFMMLIAETAIVCTDVSLKESCKSAFERGVAEHFVSEKDKYLAKVAQLDANNNSQQEDVHQDAGGDTYRDAVTAPEAETESVVVRETDEEKEMNTVWSLALKNKGRVPQWFCDLSNAYHKTNLTPEQVKSYFDMLGKNLLKAAAIAKLLNAVCAFFPDMIKVDVFREGLTSSNWTTYRTTRVSTGVVLRGLADDFKRMNIIDDQIEAAIDNCAEKSYDINTSDNIPDRIVAYGSLFLEASGRPIAKWYQGTKAVANLPAVKVKNVKIAFKKYLALTSEVEGIDDTKTLDDFNNKIPASFW